MLLPITFSRATEPSGGLGMQRIAGDPLFCKFQPAKSSILDFIMILKIHINLSHLLLPRIYYIQGPCLDLIGTRKGDGRSKFEALVPQLSCLEQIKAQNQD